jgi:hypothetical protein
LIVTLHGWKEFGVEQEVTTEGIIMPPEEIILQPEGIVALVEMEMHQTLHHQV